MLSSTGSLTSAFPRIAPGQSAYIPYLHPPAAQAARPYGGGPPGLAGWESDADLCGLVEPSRVVPRELLFKDFPNLHS